MINIYLLQFEGEEKTYVYTSIAAMYTEHSREDIGVSRDHLYGVFSKQTYHKTKKAILNKIPAFTKNDVENGISYSTAIKTQDSSIE